MGNGGGDEGGWFLVENSDQYLYHARGPGGGTPISGLMGNGDVQPGRVCFQGFLSCERGIDFITFCLNYMGYLYMYMA